LRNEANFPSAGEAEAERVADKLDGSAEPSFWLASKHAAGGRFHVVAGAADQIQESGQVQNVSVAE
jgi:hypothetical protein